MNSLKRFFRENKQLIILTTAVISGIFLVFTVLAISADSMGGKAEGATGNRAEMQQGNNSQTGDDPERDTNERPTVMQEETTEDIEQETTEKPTEAETEKPTELPPTTSPYYIKVNRAANCITIYTKDSEGNYTVPVKAMVCSVAKNITKTPLGKYSLSEYANWMYMVDGTYGQYAFRFKGPYLFHSVPYYTKNKDDLEWEQYNKLGQPASLGCVRVNVENALWLVRNCPRGTGVEIYDDAENPGPLGKPESIKIPADSPHRGWDPTDPDPNNPWRKFNPEIKVSEETVTVTVGTGEGELLAKIGAKGYDTCGNDVSDKLKLSGVDLEQQGNYTAVINLTDAIGRKAEEVKLSVTVQTEEVTTESETSSTEEVTEEEDTSAENDSSSGGETGTEESTPISDIQEDTSLETNAQEDDSTEAEATQGIQEQGSDNGIEEDTTV